MLPSLEKIKKQITDLHVQEARLLSEISQRKNKIDEIESELYKLTQIEPHLTEIHRLAYKHFLRLKKQDHLTNKDYEELEKWIGRAKSPESLKSIVQALSELEKYYPEEIKTNLYALVQKIIIGGAYHKLSK